MLPNKRKQLWTVFLLVFNKSNKRNPNINNNNHVNLKRLVNLTNLFTLSFMEMKRRDDSMKYNIKKLKVCLFLIVLFLFGSGCTGNQEQSAKENQDTNIVKVHTNNPIGQSVANQVKEKTIKREEVTGVKAVNTDKELLVALKVKQFDRFQLKNIKKKVKSDLEKMYPDHKVFVSTDQKIYLELEQLEQKLQKDQPKKKILNKEFDEIKSLMKEQA
ncbi:YhcN/YlaJ family sporulation lipoprotein [Priestia endophytica]|uniref:YhcN/YlaJ family sporulation lipoprotein n=1 Tax=Priestia endophytica TaxID=135735 RepID=UPI00124DE62F|nr:YhcN/YlaJ family sporulation lipoprotein [Priestia endophytica]KAB2495589.1 hypothetical protein F8155_06315 [Priestia endophytica]